MDKLSGRNILRMLLLVVAVMAVSALALQVSNTRSEHVQYLNVEEFKAKMDDGKGVLIDVRTTEEYTGGHIEGAVNIDFYGSFVNDILHYKKNREYYLYCRSGSRSGQAAELMAKNGFKHVWSLKNAGYDDLK